MSDLSYNTTMLINLVVMLNWMLQRLAEPWKAFQVLLVQREVHTECRLFRMCLLSAPLGCYISSLALYKLMIIVRVMLKFNANCYRSGLWDQFCEKLRVLYHKWKSRS